jgi:hypothetical protein
MSYRTIIWTAALSALSFSALPAQEQSESSGEEGEGCGTYFGPGACSGNTGSHMNKWILAFNPTPRRHDDCMRCWNGEQFVDGINCHEGECPFGRVASLGSLDYESLWALAPMEPTRMSYVFGSASFLIRNCGGTIAAVVSRDDLVGSTQAFRLFRPPAPHSFILKREDASALSLVPGVRRALRTV